EEPKKEEPKKEEPKKEEPKNPLQTQAKPAKKEPAANVKKERTKREATQPQQTSQKQSSRPANVITRPGQNKKTESGTYYIQVGSFTSSPNRHILNTIKKNNFHYTIVKKSNGAKKLLIGPYKDRVSAEKALVNVKDRINKRAFIKKN
ncbi:MAG: SPOR domain-containing protein, partial [Sulfurimonas sp.]